MHVRTLRGLPVAALLLVAATLAAGCTAATGGSTGGPTSPAVPGFAGATVAERAAMPASIAMGGLGTGVERVLVMRRAGATARQPVIVFFHGYGTATTASQEPWLTHMAQRATVVWPVYNQPPFNQSSGGEKVWPAVVRGARPVFARLERRRLIDPARLVVAGYSLGGALAADYAHAARRAGLPAAAGLYAVFPGRGLCKGAVRLPAQRGQIAGSTRILALASPHDLLAGTCEARRIVVGATAVPAARKRLRIVSNYDIGDHFAPTRTGALEQRTFWAPLDRMLAEVDRRG